MGFDRSVSVQDLAALRLALAGGDGVDQEEIDAIGARWGAQREVLRPGEKDEELCLVDAAGRPNALTAPRWLCHVLGLRHCCAHVLLWWRSPLMGRVFVFQVRSWSKATSAGEVDISVGGHVAAGANAKDTAYREMEEELGLERAHLRDGRLAYCTGYENREEADAHWDVEWREVYIGEIGAEVLENMHFKDGEVVGLYLCPEAQAQNLIDQKTIPIASGLEHSLPHGLNGGIS